MNASSEASATSFRTLDSTQRLPSQEPISLGPPFAGLAKHVPRFWYSPTRTLRSPFPKGVSRALRRWPPYANCFGLTFQERNSTATETTYTSCRPRKRERANQEQVEHSRQEMIVLSSLPELFHGFFRLCSHLSPPLLGGFRNLRSTGCRENSLFYPR